ncbi:PRC-barrel domain containing protein [Spongiactinospora sp. TRM90649]|uniref:PRC-barrel domain containing protein n=1 Tax=Spongiactinospora sp. TRM90649 TaxID=3031114 RepID=UPI0023F778A5|nr:PRC-barrel domain containing protein [Spongiactinospora sp. TRM90649]MDF5753600.1 PRC-barrel domain containing protein [Spongiactinospora sp. TRM90649]
MWNYRPGVYDDDSLNIVDFDVEATDGSIGTVDEAQHEVGSRYIVVDTGPWIFGSKHVLPAGTVDRIDPQQRKVYLARTKAQIKDAPKYDKDTYRDAPYRDELGGYYGRTGGTL